MTNIVLNPDLDIQYRTIMKILRELLTCVFLPPPKFEKVLLSFHLLSPFNLATRIRSIKDFLGLLIVLSSSDPRYIVLGLVTGMENYLD